MNALPAYLQNIPAADLAETAIANVGAGSPPYLSIQGNRFTLIDVAGNTNPIQTLHVDVVIVDVNDHVSKIFFGLNKPYDPNNPLPPICFSDNGLAPSIGSSQPQSPTCAGCPQNVWGSKVSQMGSAVKQCADQQKIAIYVPEYSDGLFLLRIPPGSFSNWRSYMAKFVGAGLNPRMVTTRISFEQNVVGTLVFQSPGYINEAEAGVVIKMVEAKASDMMVGRLDKPRVGIAQLARPQGRTDAQTSQLEQHLQNPTSVEAIGHAVHQPPFSAPVAAPAPQSQMPAGVNLPTPILPAAENQGPFAPPAALLATGQGSVTASPSNPAQQPVQRRRRTKAEMMQAAQQPAPSGPAQPVQAPFRPDPQAAQDAQFGMVQNPPAPPPGLDLDAIFK